MTVDFLAISTTPRKGGNSDILTDAILEGARAAGARTEKYVLRERPVQGCIECNGCFNTGRCVVGDNFQYLYDRLIQCHRLVFASPVYFMSLCAQAKAVVDRFQCFWAKTFLLKEPLFETPPRYERRGMLAQVGGQRGEKIIQGGLIIMRHAWRCIEMKPVEPLWFDRIDERGAIRDHPDALQEAFERGRELAQS